MTSSPRLSQLKALVIDWAQANPAVRVMILVGSQARRTHPADEWSDLDLELYVTGVKAVADDTSWLGQLGEVWVRLPYTRDDSVPEWLIVLDGAVKLDLSFHPLDHLSQLIDADPLHDVFNRGYEVLVDKDGRAGAFKPPLYHPSPQVPPSQDEFELTVSFFWYGVIYIAKQIRRGQVWLAWYRDTTLKGQLLDMVEWHARAVHGPAHDTWHDGKFMHEWVDPAVWSDLAACFAHFDPAEQGAALRATMALFRRLAQETAARLGLSYPALLDERATGFVAALLSTL